LLVVLVFVTLAWRRTARGEPLRRAAVWSAGAIIGEALIGAAIVLYEWVEADSSLARVIAVPLHLVNTFLLLGALTLSVWFASGGNRLSLRGRSRSWLVAGALGLIAIAATGAVTALADTLFPKSGTPSSAASHFLTELRIVHPIVAVTVVAFAALASRRSAQGGFPAWSRLGALTMGQMVLGFVNIWTGTPVPVQLLHLLVADIIWIAYVWLAAQTLSEPDPKFRSAEVNRGQTVHGSA
jgi:heme A synthase